MCATVWLLKVQEAFVVACCVTVSVVAQVAVPPGPVKVPEKLVVVRVEIDWEPFAGTEC